MNAITQTYEDVKPLIHSTVWRFWKRHGGDLEELRAEALLRFAESYRSYDGERGEFTTWLVSSVWWQLLRSRKQPVRKRVFSNLAEMPARREFALQSVLEGLSSEGRLVAELALNPPPDVKLTARCGRGDHLMIGIRAGIKQYLRDCGWSGEQVRNVFEEIREALA